MEWNARIKEDDHTDIQYDIKPFDIIKGQVSDP